MDLGIAQANQLETHLIRGCCVEADRSDVARRQLENIRDAAPENLDHSHLTMTIEEIRLGSDALRELADLSQVYRDRVPAVADHLQVVLPCLSRSLRDVITHYEDRTLSKYGRWRSMYHNMTNEANGLQLPKRFLLYVQFLQTLKDLLTRSPVFSFDMLTRLNYRIMQLRRVRAIVDPPAPTWPMAGIELMQQSDYMASIHWAEEVFSLPLPTQTLLNPSRSSVSFGPHIQLGYVRIPFDSRLLFRSCFDAGNISLTAYHDGRYRSPYFLIRMFDTGDPWFAVRGVHELCIERHGGSLRFRRWSRTENKAKFWATLYFATWEEMIRLYCTFVSLKIRNPLTVSMSPEEYTLRGERRLFQARIIEYGWRHSLIVYEDRSLHGIRLHVAVWDGDLQQCPVWTAFVTRQAFSTRWARRISRTTVRLASVQLFIFCSQYQQRSQRHGRTGPLEVNFFSEEACQRFAELFPRPETPSTAPTAGA